MSVFFFKLNSWISAFWYNLQVLLNWRAALEVVRFRIKFQSISSIAVCKREKKIHKRYQIYKGSFHNFILLFKRQIWLFLYFFAVYQYGTTSTPSRKLAELESVSDLTIHDQPPSRFDREEERTPARRRRLHVPSEVTGVNSVAAKRRPAAARRTPQLHSVSRLQEWVPFPWNRYIHGLMMVNGVRKNKTSSVLRFLRWTPALFVFKNVQCFLLISFDSDILVWVKSFVDCNTYKWFLCPAWLKSAGHIVFALSVRPSVRPEGQKIILSKNTF